jgi:aspartokinase-like uncharacterized kinase
VVGAAFLSATGARAVVVRLGGATIGGSSLALWLGAASAASAPVVIVPGGGRLADAVREHQARLGCSDRAAHLMALLAMDQNAIALADLCSGLRIAADEKTLEGAIAAGGASVWSPTAMVADASDIAQSWDVTSDSLALWLAARIGARVCVVVKAAVRRETTTAATALAEEGVVDAAFPDYLRRTGVPAFLLGPGDEAALGDALARGDVAGAPILLA